MRVAASTQTFHPSPLRIGVASFGEAGIPTKDSIGGRKKYESNFLSWILVGKPLRPDSPAQKIGGPIQGDSSLSHLPNHHGQHTTRYHPNATLTSGLL